MLPSLLVALPSHSCGSADVAVGPQPPAGHTLHAASALPGRPTTRSMSRQSCSAQSRQMDIDTATSGPAPKRSKVQHHIQAAGQTVTVASGKRKRAAETADNEGPAAKRQASPNAAALPGNSGFRSSTRVTNRKNYYEQDDEEEEMADEPEITKADVPRRKRTAVTKKGIRKPWR